MSATEAFFHGRRFSEALAVGSDGGDADPSLGPAPCGMKLSQPGWASPCPRVAQALLALPCPGHRRSSGGSPGLPAPGCCGKEKRQHGQLLWGCFRASFPLSSLAAPGVYSHFPNKSQMPCRPPHCLSLHLGLRSPRSAGLAWVAPLPPLCSKAAGAAER